jgi:hypothetical protein
LEIDIVGGQESLSLLQQKTVMMVASHLPDRLKRLAKSVYFRGNHWAHPSLKEFGTVQDLYYWVADDKLDSMLLLQNYFSAFFPELETGTHGSVSLFDKDGQLLGVKKFTVGQHGSTKIKVSSMLEELQVSSSDGFGTLEVHMAIPPAVLDHIQDQQSLYFWDRFYMGYTTSRGQTFFTHGVDKTHIYPEDGSKPIEWYKKPRGEEWAPEIPVDIEDYERFTVVMINRTSQSSNMTLSLSDAQDNSLDWSQVVPSKGVRRFELTNENTQGLDRLELRMRMKGMASEFGRPVVFKEFPNGAMSAMHC